MLKRLLKAVKADPAGFIPRAMSAASEVARLESYRVQNRVGISSRGYIAHVGVHRSGNAGDTALFHATREVVDRLIAPQKWRLIPVRRSTTEDDISHINEHAKAVLLGGGGLIIRDSVPNSSSGWQWNISLQTLKKLKSPLVGFAIGYNRFDGQGDFDRQFEAHISETISRSAFFGLRNRGSIRSLSHHLPPDLAQKLSFQPCPTTIISKLQNFSPTSSGKVVAVNLAFDRSELRFSDNPEDVVREIASCLKWLDAKGWKIIVTIHDPRDRVCIPILQQERVPFSIVDLPNAGYQKIVEFYRNVPLTLGMRGHGQMIPFGVGNAIFSLVSHPKLAYFLDDIGHPEWMVDIRRTGFRDQMIDKISDIIADIDQTRRTIDSAQQILFDTTVDNVRKFSPFIGGGSHRLENAILPN